MIFYSKTPIFNDLSLETFQATVVSTLHGLAAEAGTLGLILQLSKTEEYVVEVIIYVAFALKVNI